MNKAQFVEKLASQLKKSKSETEVFLDATLEVIQRSLKKGDEIKFVGFGTFYKQSRKSRQGRNPKTGETVTIPSDRVPRFRPGKDFKDFLNEKK